LIIYFGLIYFQSILYIDNIAHAILKCFIHLDKL